MPPGGDVVGAARLVRARGAETVVLVWFAGVVDGEYTFDRATVRRLPAVPTLYLSTADDGFGAGPRHPEHAPVEPGARRLVVLDGYEHGTEIRRFVGQVARR